MSTTQHYSQPITVMQAAEVPRRIRNAYGTAGLTPPPLHTPVQNALEAEPSAEDVAQRLAHEAMTVGPKEAPNWTRDAIARLAHAKAADELRHKLLFYKKQVTQAHAATMIVNAIGDLSAPFKTAVEKLVQCSAALPADPFDMSAIVATDVTKEAREAGQALAQLAAIGGIHTRPSSVHITPAVMATLHVIEIADVDAREVDRLTRRPLNPDDPDTKARTAVRDYCEAVIQKGADVALVEVARGTYGEHVRFSLAQRSTEIHERADRMDAAITDKGIDSWGYKSKRRASRAKPAIVLEK